jgi:hypothetical protein
VSRTQKTHQYVSKIRNVNSEDTISKMYHPAIGNICGNDEGRIGSLN